jgi:hypothetical protein
MDQDDTRETPAIMPEELQDEDLESFRKAYQEGYLKAAVFALAYYRGYEHAALMAGRAPKRMPYWLFRAALDLMERGVRASAPKRRGRHADPDTEAESIRRDLATALAVMREVESGTTWADIDATRTKAYKRTLRRIRAGESVWLYVNSVKDSPDYDKLAARAKARAINSVD